MEKEVNLLFWNKKSAKSHYLKFLVRAILRFFFSTSFLYLKNLILIKAEKLLRNFSVFLYQFIKYY